MVHHSTSLPQAGWRNDRMAVSGQMAPDSSFDEEGPGILLTAGFWLGGVASLAVWTSIWTGLAWLLDRI